MLPLPQWESSLIFKVRSKSRTGSSFFMLRILFGGGSRVHKAKLGSAGQPVLRCSPGSGYVWHHRCFGCSAWGWSALWKSPTEMLFLRVVALKVTMFGLLMFQKGFKRAWLLRSDFRRVVKENSICSPGSRWISIKDQL